MTLKNLSLYPHKINAWDQLKKAISLQRDWIIITSDSMSKPDEDVNQYSGDLACDLGLSFFLKYAYSSNKFDNQNIYVKFSPQVSDQHRTFNLIEQELLKYFNSNYQVNTSANRFQALKEGFDCHQFVNIVFFSNQIYCDYQTNLEIIAKAWKLKSYSFCDNLKFIFGLDQEFLKTINQSQSKDLHRLVYNYNNNYMISIDNINKKDIQQHITNFLVTKKINQDVLSEVTLDWFCKNLSSFRLIDLFLSYFFKNYYRKIIKSWQLYDIKKICFDLQLDYSSDGFQQSDESSIDYLNISA